MLCVYYYCLLLLIYVCLCLLLLVVSNQNNITFSKSNIETCQWFSLDRIANWSYCSGSAWADKPELISQKHTIILYYYSMFKNVCSLYIRRMVGLCLHFRTSVRLPGTAYLMFPRLNPHFEFDTEFGKTLKNQRLHHFLYRKKSSKIPSQHHSALIK